MSPELKKSVSPSQRGTCFRCSRVICPLPTPHQGVDQHLLPHAVEGSSVGIAAFHFLLILIFIKVNRLKNSASTKVKKYQFPDHLPNSILFPNTWVCFLYIYFHFLNYILLTLFIDINLDIVFWLHPMVAEDFSYFVPPHSHPLLFFR